MNDYVIISDSTCDLSQELVDELKVAIQPMSFTICDKEYKNYPDEREMKLEDFYNLMNEGHMGKTAQLNIIDVENFFTPYLEKELDILCVAFSSGLSGSCNSIRLAAQELSEKFPQRKIIVVDSLQASTGEGLLVYEAAINKNNGMTIEENAKSLESMKLNVRAWFTVSQLETLRRGGRLSNAAAFAAKLLNIKPVLHVDDEGHLKAVYKKMGRKLALKQLIESSIDEYDKEGNHVTFVSHANCEADALKVKEMLEEAYKKENINSKILISKIGPVIGSHAGPGTLAVFTIGDKR